MFLSYSAPFMIWVKPGIYLPYIFFISNYILSNLWWFWGEKNRQLLTLFRPAYFIPLFRPGWGQKRPPPQFSQKRSHEAEFFPKVVKTKFIRKKSISIRLTLLWRHFAPKNLQNYVIWRKKSISVKMLQMGWNFDTSSKIRQKTQKSA